MPTTTRALFRGAATTNTATTLYTVPSATTTVVSDILVTNTSGTSSTFTIALNGTAIASAVPVGANDTTSISLKQVISATQTITGGAGSTAVNIHISGVEIS